MTTKPKPLTDSFDEFTKGLTKVPAKPNELTSPDLTVPEYMVRMKLPNPAAFASCPSGDTEYESAYQKALDDARPEGFEFVYPRRNEKWPKDSEGWTWARLRCTDGDNALSAMLEKVRGQQVEMENIKRILRKLRRLMGGQHDE